MKKISPQQIEDIINYLNTRQTLKAKEIINNLELSNEEDILKDILDLRNHHGKSTITNQDLNNIINKYGKQF